MLHNKTSIVSIR